ncbi:MAG: hypothetical protein WDO74_13805 [Pseudomonadota bacterium]
MCGDAGNCDAYCQLASKACHDEFTNNYTDEDDCKEQCASLEGATKGDYSVKGAKAGNTVQCRGLAVSQALVKPEGERAAACAAAFGGETVRRLVTA